MNISLSVTSSTTPPDPPGPTDTTAPKLTEGDATRTSEANATVKFISDEAGTYYYAIVESGTEVPSDLTTSGSCVNGNNTINLTTLAGAGAKDIYIIVTDAAGNMSDKLIITIPAYTAPSYGISASPESYDFGNLNEGYIAPSAQTITITNESQYLVTLTQPTATYFEIGTLSKTDLSAGDTATFTVQPKTGYTKGTYSETITVTGSLHPLDIGGGGIEPWKPGGSTGGNAELTGMTYHAANAINSNRQTENTMTASLHVSFNVNAPLSTDAGVTAVSVDGVAGTISGTTITVELPHNTTPPTDSSKISITVPDSASTTTPTTSDNGAAWTFTVTAEDGSTKETYTINVSVNGTHTYGNWQSNGQSHWKECVCGKKIDEAHTWNVEAATEETDKHCTVCGYVAEEKLEPVHTHQGKYISGKDATCTEEGSKEYYSCSCGRFFEDESCEVEIADLDTWKIIPKLNHTWSADYRKEHADAEKHYHVCTVCGTKDEGTAHTWNVEAATEETDKHCTVCGYVAEAQLGHVHVGMYVAGKDASCTEEGSREYYSCACGKFFEDESCKAEITDLDTWKVIPKLNHTWSTDYLKEHADAEKHYHVCTVCGAKDAGGTHTWNVEAATEETDKHCTVCGYVAEEKLEPVHTHRGKHISGKDATCTEEGSKEYYSCSCGRFFEDQSCEVEIADLDTWKIIPKLNHTWSADYLKEHADAEKHYHVCTVCGTKDAGEAHTWNVEAATEETDKHCTVCGYVTEEKLEPVHNHQGKHISGKDATCTEDGNNEYWYCETCGKYFRDEEMTQEITKKETVIEARGHGKVELKNKKEATCTTEGYTGDTVCKDCGKVLEKGETIPKLAHSYKDGTCTVCGAPAPHYKPADSIGSGKHSNDAGKGSNSPQTGDNSNIALWIFLMLVAGAALAGTAVYARKKKRSR